MRHSALGSAPAAGAMAGLLALTILVVPPAGSSNVKGRVWQLFGAAAQAQVEPSALVMGTEIIYSFGWEDGSFQDGYQGWYLGDSDAAGGTHYWDEDSDAGARAHTGSRAMHCADFVNGAQAGTPQGYYDGMEAYAMRKIDLSGWSTIDTVRASFYLWFDTEADHDWFEFWVSGSNAAPGSWNQLDKVSGNSGGWVQRSYDLAPYAGKPDVWIAFQFASDESGHGYEGAYVDDLLIAGRRALAPPVLGNPGADSALCDLTPSFSWQPVADAVSYEIEVDDDAGFGSAEVSAASGNTNFAVPSPLDAGLYHWRVRGVDDRGGGPWSASWRFSTAGSEPAAPTLSKPADGAQVCAAPYALRWNSLAGATLCKVQVDDDPAFRSPEYQASGAAYCTGKLDINTLLAPQTYHWRVLVANACGEGPWSETRQFQVRAIQDAPVLLQPAHGSASGDPTPSFQWLDAATADIYRLRVDDEASLSSPLVDVSTSELAHTLVQALGPGTYFWQVRGENECGDGPWSPILEFTVEQDTVRPARIDDLSAMGGTKTGTVDLSWTAPGDDGLVGTASGYRVRYNLVAITEDNWERCAEVDGEPLPGAPGSHQALTVEGLIPDQVYFFAIQSWDEVPNFSEISNSVAARAALGPGWHRFYLPLAVR